MRRRFLRYVGIPLVSASLIVATPTIAYAGTARVTNACAGHPDGEVRYQKADGIWRGLKCGWWADNVYVVSGGKYPLVVITNTGIRLHVPAGQIQAVDSNGNVSSVRAWTDYDFK